MPEPDAAALIRKALADDVFRVSLSRDFDSTVARHNLDLTSTEVEALKNVDWSQALPAGPTGAGAAATWVHIYKGNVGGLEDLGQVVEPGQ